MEDIKVKARSRAENWNENEKQYLIELIDEKKNY